MEPEADAGCTCLVRVLWLSVLAFGLVATGCRTAASSGPAASPGSDGPLGAIATPVPCDLYAAPDRSVGAEIAHLKTAATVLEVTSPCTVRVTIAGGAGSLFSFNGRTVVLRSTATTTFASAAVGDLAAIGKLGLKPGDSFTLSFDSRPFPDGSYPLNFMNR